MASDQNWPTIVFEKPICAKTINQEMRLKMVNAICHAVGIAAYIVIEKTIGWFFCWSVDRLRHWIKYRDGFMPSK